jgi:hypothetical protein
VNLCGSKGIRTAIAEEPIPNINSAGKAEQWINIISAQPHIREQHQFKHQQNRIAEGKWFWAYWSKLVHKIGAID